MRVDEDLALSSLFLLLLLLVGVDEDLTLSLLLLLLVRVDEDGGLHLKPPKFEHIFVAVITFFTFLLCKYF